MTHSRYYDGEFQDGLRHGKGTFVFRGFRYDGEWRKDKMEGKGKRVDADGSTYRPHAAPRKVLAFQFAMQSRMCYFGRF